MRTSSIKRRSLVIPWRYRKNERTVRNWLNAGLLPGHQIHGRWIIDPGVLSVWLEGKAK